MNTNQTTESQTQSVAEGIAGESMKFKYSIEADKSGSFKASCEVETSKDTGNQIMTDFTRTIVEESTKMTREEFEETMRRLDVVMARLPQYAGNVRETITVLAGTANDVAVNKVKTRKEIEIIVHSTQVDVSQAAAS